MKELRRPTKEDLKLFVEQNSGWMFYDTTHGVKTYSWMRYFLVYWTYSCQKLSHIEVCELVPEVSSGYADFCHNKVKQAIENKDKVTLQLIKNLKFFCKEHNIRYGSE